MPDPTGSVPDGARWIFALIGAAACAALHFRVERSPGGAFIAAWVGAILGSLISLPLSCISRW